MEWARGQVVIAYQVAEQRSEAADKCMAPQIETAYPLPWAFQGDA
eukprot:CAMPEP_0119398346 /NCGR_PEP_ID=MMETSP1334-20130426/140799_1 /TAXON_ID=127549 /ORGANISM="Calcidiscus leptoporus, Strain RCC1130" /LENGTH=44 /DNA_ID= /DNA_START= /DNA_END= /DNA_ORIENTATION=